MTPARSRAGIVQAHTRAPPGLLLPNMEKEMNEYGSSSPKEQQQLAICQRLLAEKSYISQEEIRRDLQYHGFSHISQSTVSRLLKLLGAVKIRNAKGQKIYATDPLLRPVPDAARSIAEMVVSVEHNGEFILIHTVTGYSRAVARVLDYHQLPDILGVVAGSNVVWVAPRTAKRTALVHRHISELLRKPACAHSPLRKE